MSPLVVVYRALGLGDLLTAVPALRAVRRKFVDRGIALACPGWLAPLVGWIDAVDRVIPTEPLAPLPRHLAPEVAINLHGEGPASHRAVLNCRPDRLIAFHHSDVPGTERQPRWSAEEHEVERWCRLLRANGIPADADDLALAPPPPVPSALGATVLHPGASAPARRWPPDRWATVARAVMNSGRAVIITGAPDEADLASSVARRAGLPDDAVLAGRTSLLELASVIATAARVVSGDTGVAHLATAFGTPSVVLFGPVPPRLWGPPSERGAHIALWAGRAGDPHGNEPDPGLLEIEPNHVIDALRHLDRTHIARQPVELGVGS